MPATCSTRKGCAHSAAQSTASVPIAASAASSPTGSSSSLLVHGTGPPTAVRQGPVRLRLCPSSRSADRAARPQGRRRQAPTIQSIRPIPGPISARSLVERSARPPASNACGTRRAARRSPDLARPRGSNEEAYSFQKLVRTGFNVDHCTRSARHVVGRGADGGDSVGRDRRPSWPPRTPRSSSSSARPTENHPVAATFFKRAKDGKTLIVMDPRGQALRGTRPNCNSSGC